MSEKEHLRWFSGPLIHVHTCIQPHIHTTIQPHIHTCVRPWVRSPMTQRENYSLLQGPEPRSSHALQALATAGFSRQVHTSLNFLTRVTRLLARGAGDGIWGLPQPFGSLSKSGSCFRGSGGWSYRTQRIVVTEKSGSHWSGQAEALQASAFCHYVYQSFTHSAPTWPTFTPFCVGASEIGNVCVWFWLSFDEVHVCVYVCAHACTDREERGGGTET